MCSASLRSAITVASYNIHLGIGRDGQFKPQRIAAVIGEMNADIVALQEVALGAPGFNMLEYLRDACRLHAVAGPTLVTANEWFLWGRPLRWLHGHFRRTPAPATFPSGRPFIALDRVWVKPRRALTRVAVHATALSRVASDRLPLTAVLDFGTPSRPAQAASSQEIQ